MKQRYTHGLRYKNEFSKKAVSLSGKVVLAGKWS